ncbi:MAG TPA: carboxypeptidase regulatory-like domain-containing protein, partial [Roseimicrobium sp.]|nr:carboxypeptidase regulatory-like domain-containing protein [Roseimicrobium sp.]
MTLTSSTFLNQVYLIEENLGNMQKRNLFRGLMVAATISIVAACSPTSTPTVPGTPSSSPSASASVTPTAEPSPTASATATAEPSPTASATASATASPTAQPTASASATATAAPTASPTATSTSDISVVEKTTFNGKVYDDTNAPLDGVTVKAKSLNSSVPYEATTTTAGGSYAFNNAPAGVTIEIQASKPGYATRRRVEVLKSNKQGDPDANRYDFGTDGEDVSDFGVAYNALSDKPEVTAVTPGRNASGVNPDTSFVLKFSEPMDTDTVEENFGVYAATDETLSVDVELDAIDRDFPEDGGSLVWDESAFNISWNSDDTEVTFTFKDEQALLTDTESENVPDYAVSLTADDEQIKDKSGITRDLEDGGYFKLTDGDFEVSYKFSIDTDEEEPALENVEALTDENGNAEGDEIKIEFSEPMVFYTEDPGEVRGNIDGTAADEDPINPDNYFFSVNDGAEFSWGTYFPENIASFDTDDRTHKTVLLRVNASQASPNAV